jgi:excisionase family DNA binding protein
MSQDRDKVAVFPGNKLSICIISIKHTATNVELGHMEQKVFAPGSLSSGAPRLANLTELSRCLSALDREGAMTVVDEGCRERRSSAAAITGLLAPALVEVGRQWAAGETGAAEAMAAAAIVRSCIPCSAVPATQAFARRRMVAVCCPPGELHDIPGEMVAELLRQHGWAALSMGSGLTPEQLPRFLADQRPAALLVSATTACALPGTAQVIAVAHGHGVPVLVGGAAFGRDDLLALRLGAAGWAATATQAVARLESWWAAPPVLPPAPFLPAGYLRFDAELPTITAAAAAVMGRLRTTESLSLDESDELLDQLLRHLGATLLVDDGRILHDFVSRGSEYCRARYLSPTRIDEALRAVGDALPADCDRARRFVAEGREHLAWADRTPSEIGWEPEPYPVAVGPRHPVAPPAEAGQVFADLLYVAASTCRAPMAWLSVPQPGGGWSTLRQGTERVTDRRDRPGENQLFTLVASRREPLEISDLTAHPDLAATALVREAGGVEFAYGIALRSSLGVLVGVLCILDRRPRQLSGRERRATDAIARQLTVQLERHHRNEPSAGGAVFATDDRTAATAAHPCGDEKLMRTSEVAAMFAVTNRTVSNWAAAGKLASIRTAGRQLRFRSNDVIALLGAKQRCQ